MASAQPTGQASGGTPSVSVVIPTFNRKAKTAAAVRSVLLQTLAPLEVIVVDDASTDGTVATDFTDIDPRVRFVGLEKNGGGGVARNAGIDAALGDWVALLDSDDHWMEDKLERQFAAAGHPSPDQEVLLAANVTLRRPDRPDELYNPMPYAAEVALDDYYLVRDCSLQTSTLILPTRLAQRVRFDDRLRRHQDWDFTLRLVLGGTRVLYLHDPVAIYEAAPDEGRVSQGANIAPTLRWFGLAPALTTPRARHIFYLNRWFQVHYSQDRLHAIGTLTRMSLAYPAGVARTGVRLFKMARHALSRSAA